MTKLPDAICPLCSEVFPRKLLYQHVEREPIQVRERTVRVIQSVRPHWVEDYGACAACWKSYREAGQVIGILKSLRQGEAREEEAVP
jgi:hypothetical protein